MSLMCVDSVLLCANLNPTNTFTGTEQNSEYIRQGFLRLIRSCVLILLRCSRFGVRISRCCCDSAVCRAGLGGATSALVGGYLRVATQGTWAPRKPSPDRQRRIRWAAACRLVEWRARDASTQPSDHTQRHVFWALRHSGWHQGARRTPRSVRRGTPRPKAAVTLPPPSSSLPSPPPKPQ